MRSWLVSDLRLVNAPYLISLSYKRAHANIRISMLENEEHKEKKNFTESEIEVLLAEVEVCAGMLFESLSSGLSHKTKCVAWQCIAQAVNEVGGQQRSLKDIKKKLNYSPKIFACVAISSISANAAILLLANYYFIGHFIGHRCIGIINMRGSKLFHNV